MLTDIWRLNLKTPSYLLTNVLFLITVAKTKVFPAAENFENIKVGLVNSSGEVLISKDDFDKLGIDGMF